MYMGAFAEAWPEADFVQQPVGQLPWGHNLVLMTKLGETPWHPTFAAEALAESGPEHAYRDRAVVWFAFGERELRPYPSSPPQWLVDIQREQGNAWIATTGVTKKKGAS